MEDALRPSDHRRWTLRGLFRSIPIWIVPFPLLYFLVLSWGTVGDPIMALWWHVRHGNYARFNGHSFRLPLLWRSTNPDRGEIFRLSHSVQLNIDHAIGGIRNAQQAEAFQRQILATYGRGVEEGRFSPETIRAHDLSFLCVHENSAQPWALYLCVVPGTDWQIGLTGGQAGLDDARRILASAR